MATSSISTVPVVLAQLVDTIGPLTVGMGLNGIDVQVTHAARIADRSYDDIDIGDIRDHFIAIPTMKQGRKKRDEAYKVSINIWVVRDDAQDANIQAMALAEVILDWAADNPDLGLGIDALWVDDWELSLNMTYDDASVWRSHVSLEPTVRARLF